MNKEYKVGDIIEITHVVDEIKETEDGIRVFFHDRFSGFSYNFLAKGFLKLIEKEEVGKGEEVKIKFTITSIDEKSVKFENKRMTTNMKKEKFLEMMAQEE